MTVRAKVQLGSKMPNPYNKDSTILSFHGVYEGSDAKKDENIRFNQASPSINLTLLCDNPEASAQFDQHKTYFLDFTPAE